MEVGGWVFWSTKTSFISNIISLFCGEVIEGFCEDGRRREEGVQGLTGRKSAYNHI